jgi:hypothetical protein
LPKSSDLKNKDGGGRDTRETIGNMYATFRSSLSRA